jgi:hypothetical protein
MKSIWIILNTAATRRIECSIFKLEPNINVVIKQFTVTRFG